MSNQIIIPNNYIPNKKICWNNKEHDYMIFQNNLVLSAFYGKNLIYSLDKNEKQYVIGPLNQMLFTSVVSWKTSLYNGSVNGIQSAQIRSIYDYSGLATDGSYGYWTADGKHQYSYKMRMNNKLKRYICIEDYDNTMRDRANGAGSICEFCLVFENTANNEKTNENINTVYINFTNDKDGNDMTICNIHSGCIGSDLNKTLVVDGHKVKVDSEYITEHQTQRSNEKFIIDLSKCHIDYLPRFTQYEKLTSNNLQSINQYVGGLSIGFDNDGYAYLKWDGSGAKNGFGDIDTYPPYMYFALHMNSNYLNKDVGQFDVFGSEYGVHGLRIRTNDTGIFD